jgi:hypothetical protein
MKQRYCLALDLKDDNSLIGEYESYHKNVPLYDVEEQSYGVYATIRNY